MLVRRYFDNLSEEKMKTTQTFLLMWAAIFFTIGGFCLNHLETVMGMIVMPFAVGTILILIALNLSHEILREFDLKTKYLVQNQMLTSKGWILQVKDMSTGLWHIAETKEYPPQGFRKEYFWGHLLIPKNEKLSYSYKATLRKQILNVKA